MSRLPPAHARCKAVTRAASVSLTAQTLLSNTSRTKAALPRPAAARNAFRLMVEAAMSPLGVKRGMASRHVALVVLVFVTAAAHGHALAEFASAYDELGLGGFGAISMPELAAVQANAHDRLFVW